MFVFFRRSLNILALSCLMLAPCAPYMDKPAEAAVQRSADFAEGQTIGIGLYGAAYDYGLGGFSGGLYANTMSYTSSFSPNLNEPPRIGLRLAARSYVDKSLSLGWIGGLHVRQKTSNLIPGDTTVRNELVPDVGLSVAYSLQEFDIPFILRLNMTLGLSLGESNPLNSLQFGPQTGLELAWVPRENLEITLAGGTLLGMRLTF